MRMVRRHLKNAGKSFRRQASSQPKRPGDNGTSSKPGRKQSVNLSVDAALLRLRDMKINLSQALEDTLRKRTEVERIR